MMQNDRKKVCAIIVAAGSGKRMNSKVTKQRIKIGALSIVKRAVMAFEKCRIVDSIVVVSRCDEIEFVKSELVGDITKLYAVVEGGSTRANSVKNGFNSIPSDADIVAIHDAARCLVTPEIIEKVVNYAFVTGAASAVSYVHDTIKRVDCEGRIVSTPDREMLRAASTPQVFSVDIYREALMASAELNGITDDNMLVENIGKAVYTVDIGRENIKVTTEEDLMYAEYILTRRGEI